MRIVDHGQQSHQNLGLRGLQHAAAPVADAVDAERRKRVLSIGTGGLSGPCVKPVALRMVWQVAHAVKIPVVGWGGISSATDAVEFLLAGASAVEIGTANFVDPAISAKVAQGIDQYLERHGFSSVKEIIGLCE